MPNEVTVTKFLRSKHKREFFEWEIFLWETAVRFEKKAEKKAKKSSEIKSGLDLGSTDLDTKKSPGNAGPTLASKLNKSDQWC